MRGIELGHHGWTIMEGKGLSLRLERMDPMDDYGFTMVVVINSRSSMVEH